MTHHNTRYVLELVFPLYFLVLLDFDLCSLRVCLVSDILPKS